VASLFLLFLYASAGARASIAERQHKFMSGLVLTCEMLAYVSAVSSFALGYSVFGNPNALGAIIGVAVIPVLLWAALVAENRGLRQRRFFALALCGALLYQANSRASTLAAIVVILVFTVALRHQRLLLQCAFVSLLFLTAMAVISPSQMDERVSEFTGRVIYKASGTHPGAFGSRLSPWTETLSVINRSTKNRLFGTGFGTSELGEFRPGLIASSVYTIEGSNREHGNSYLALAEYMGLLGIVPFLILLFMLVRMLVRICRWMRRTANPYHYCIPFTLVVIAGLVHACFEDWLFAVGSYLCLFFWVSVFLLIDLAPELKAELRMPAPRPFPAFAQPPVLRRPTA
jgi:O-antigen ligase